MSNARRKLPKSLVEEIMENTLPIIGESLFNKHPFLKYVLLTLIYSLLILFLYISLQFSVGLFLSLMITVLGIILWSGQFSKVTQSIRDTRYPFFNPFAIDIHCQWYEFLINNHSLILSTVFSFFGISYFISTNLFDRTKFLFNVSENTPEPVLIVLYFTIFLLTFDISFRVFTSLNGILSIIYRNIKYEQLFRFKKETDESILFYLVLSTQHDRGIFILFLIFVFWTPLPLLLGDLLLLSLFFGVFLSIYIGYMGSLVWVRRLKMKSLPKQAINPLIKEYRAFFATVQPSKLPHITPVLFGFDGLNLYFNTSLISKKIKNLRFSSNAAVFLKSSQNNVKIIMNGHARSYGYNLFTGIFIPIIYSAEMLFAFLILRNKYSEALKQYKQQKLPLRWSAKPFIARTLIKFTPTHIKVIPLR